MKYETVVALLPTLLALGGLAAFSYAILCFERRRPKRGLVLYAIGALCLFALVFFHYIVDAVTFSAFLST